MKKKRKIDFIIQQTGDERLIFRFYPRRSSCHSFNEKPPTKPEEIYKVYYSYAIIQQWKYESNDQWESEVMFSEPCDECSIIDEVAQRCLLLADGLEVFKREDGVEIQLLDQCILPFGMGTNWTISKRTCIEYGYDEDDKDIVYTYYIFMLFDYGGKGFKFTLEGNDIKAFGEYLNGCCEYMLAHGDPI